MQQVSYLRFPTKTRSVIAGSFIVPFYMEILSDTIWSLEFVLKRANHSLAFPGSQKGHYKFLLDINHM